METLSPPSFLSSEPTARIEPDDFITHVLSYRGLAPHDMGLRHTALLTFIPALIFLVLAQHHLPREEATRLERAAAFGEPVGQQAAAS